MRRAEVSPSAPLADRLEARLEAHADALALLVIAAGFLLSVYYSAASYLNPDEGQHVGAAGARTLWGALVRSGKSLAHPPLLALVEHAVMRVGRSEWLLRLPSVIAGSAAQWFVFRWLRKSSSAACAFAAVVYLVASPAMLSASTEVRQYGLLLFGIAGALDTMERMLARPRMIRVGAFAVFLYLAIVSHYSAAWITLTLAGYVSLRLWQQRGPASSVVRWGLSQAGVTGLYACLYFAHLAGLRGGPMEASAMSWWLRGSYFRPGEESALAFVFRTLGGTFKYCAGGVGLGTLTGALFVIGILAALFPKSGSENRPRRDYALLLVLPLVIGCAGALARLLPFGGTRHVSYVLPFVAAGVGLGIATLLRQRLSAVLLLGLLVLPIRFLSMRPANDPERMRRADLTEALDHLQKIVAADAVLVVDDQTRYVLRAYLEPSAPDQGAWHRGVKEARLGGHRVAWNPETWNLKPKDVPSYARDLSRALELPTGEPVWLMSVGWHEAHLDAALPRGMLVSARHFGRISVIQVRVGARG